MQRIGPRKSREKKDKTFWLTWEFFLVFFWNGKTRNDIQIHWPLDKCHSEVFFSGLFAVHQKCFASDFNLRMTRSVLYDFAATFDVRHVYGVDSLSSSSSVFLWGTLTPPCVCPSTTPCHIHHLKLSPVKKTKTEAAKGRKGKKKKTATNRTQHAAPESAPAVLVARARRAQISFLRAFSPVIQKCKINSPQEDYSWWSPPPPALDEMGSWCLVHCGVCFDMFSVYSLTAGFAAAAGDHSRLPVLLWSSFHLLFSLLLSHFSGFFSTKNATPIVIVARDEIELVFFSGLFTQERSKYLN